MADLKLIHQEPDAESVKKESVKKVILKDTEKTNDSKEEVDLEVTGNLTVKGSINPNDPWYQVIPKYTIVMWYGSDKEVPKGWAICDGENNTPDLRGRFVMGASKEEDEKKYHSKDADLKDKTTSYLKKESEYIIVLSEYNAKKYENDIKENEYKKTLEKYKDKHQKDWNTLTEDQKNNDTTDEALKVKSANVGLVAAKTAMDSAKTANDAAKKDMDSAMKVMDTAKIDVEKAHAQIVKKVNNREVLKNQSEGGSPFMIKKKNISGSGLDMSKAEYVTEIDYPPYMVLYYIMKL